MWLTKTVLGQIDHRNVEEIHMDSGNGAAVDLISYGAAIRRILLPDREGLTKNVALGFADWNDYKRNPLYAGATLCPNAGRILGALLPVGETVHRLSANDGRNSLHGGPGNAAHRCWEVESAKTGADFCSVTFAVQLADGLDGFPGNRTVRIRYTLRNPLRLEIEMEAVSDRATYLNLSNHSYFNLSGDFSRSGLAQELQIFGDRFIANDGQHLPLRTLPCSGTAFDFEVPVSLQAQIDRFPADLQLLNANGYNNAFLLSEALASRDAVPGKVRKAAVLRDVPSGRSLTLYTDAPALVLYSGGYIGSDKKLSSGVLSSDSCAVALEAQDVPDTPHFCPKSCKILGPGETYRRQTVYVFGVM